MLGTRYEEYVYTDENCPFVLHLNLERTRERRSSERNWHEDIELQFCTQGSGIVLLDGRQVPFQRGDVIAVNSGLMHYTQTDAHLVYDCLIISAAFLRKIGISPEAFEFEERICCDEAFVDRFLALKAIYEDIAAPFRTAAMYACLTEICLLLAQKHAVHRTTEKQKGKAFENVKATILYIRKNYEHKLSLDDIAGYIYTDKYALCREFKRMTGQTILQYTNVYRCQMATQLLQEGNTIKETARRCGFQNDSLFSKTFKRYMGVLPSKWLSSCTSVEPA